MITIGSRGSQLALWQAHHIAARLTEMGVETRVRVIKTTGDKIMDVPLARVGGKGLFTKEIEDALLDRSIDVAVHSLKDLPGELPEGLILSAIPEREDPRDALVGLTIDDLEPGTIVGTSSLRRSAQLRVRDWKPGLEIRMLRGNVDTRLRKLDEGEYNAVVLAVAGLHRLGLADRITEVIPPWRMCPAGGQGALAIETRDDGLELQEIVSRLDHADTRKAVTAERALLALLGGSCQVPIGAHAIVEDGRVRLRGVVISPDGSRKLQVQGADLDPILLGQEVGRELIKQGAREILDAVYGP